MKKTSAVKVRSHVNPSDTTCPPPPILTCCHEGTSLFEVPPLFHDPFRPCPFGRLCGKHAPRKRQCHLKGCDQSYWPSCHIMVFCCRECYEKSGLRSRWEFLCKISDNGCFSRLLENKRKKRYRGTIRGQESRHKEYIVRYEKQKASEAERKRMLAAVVDYVPPVVKEEKTTPVIPLPPGFTEEAREHLRDAIFKMLTPEKYESKTVSFQPGEDDTPVPRCCKRAGCETVIVPRSSKTIKRFCSGVCRNALRNILQGLKEAFQVTRCPLIKLLGMLLRMQ